MEIDEYTDGAGYWNAVAKSVGTPEYPPTCNTYTAPSTMANVWLLPESVGFWQAAELSPGWHRLDEDSALAARVLVISCTTPVP